MYVQWMALFEHEAKHLALRRLPKCHTELDRYCKAIGEPSLSAYATGTEDSITYRKTPDLLATLNHLSRYLDELGEDFLDDDEPETELANPLTFKAVRAELKEWTTRLAEAQTANRGWGLVLILTEEN